MPKWLMVLVATACLVICAYGANSVLSHWQAKREANANRTAMWEILQAPTGDVDKATETCRRVKTGLGLADGLNWDSATRNSARQIIAICESNGFL